MEIDVAFKYSTIKSSFVSIIKKDILIDACFRTHQIIIYSYQLLRLYIYYINRGTLKMLFKALTKNPNISGPKPKGENLTIGLQKNYPYSKTNIMFTLFILINIHKINFIISYKGI